MTDSATDSGKTAPDADETPKTAADMDMARKIWLAGVGAYGKVHAETQGAVEKLTQSAGETFEHLVAVGEEFEERVRKSLAKSPEVEKAGQAVETAAAKAQAFRAEQKAALEARLGKVRETVTDTLAPWNVPAMAQALEKLTAQVDALTQEVAALKAARD